MTLRAKIKAITPMLSLVIFLTVGFVFGRWDYAWLAFLLIPLMPFVLGYKKFKFSVSLIILIIYLILGFVFKAWHPGWIVFLLVPIIHILLLPNPSDIKKKYVVHLDDDDDF